MQGGRSLLGEFQVFFALIACPQMAECASISSLQAEASGTYTNVIIIL